MTLSEKAKGKRRATEPDIPEESRELTIRFTEGYPDLLLHLARRHPCDPSPAFDIQFPMPFIERSLSFFQFAFMSIHAFLHRLPRVFSLMVVTGLGQLRSTT